MRFHRFGAPDFVCLRANETADDRSGDENCSQQNAEPHHAAERNRAAIAFNSRKISTRNQAACATGAAGGDVILSSSSRRTIAFNFPPSSTSRQVRYIHVSRTMSDASAR